MRRGKIDIIIDILETATEEANKTKIVCKANLNFKLADKYLALLQEQGLIENKTEKYIITEKGKEFLERAQDMFLNYSKISEKLETRNEIGSQLSKVHPKYHGECCSYL